MPIALSYLTLCLGLIWATVLWGQPKPDDDVICAAPGVRTDTKPPESTLCFVAREVRLMPTGRRAVRLWERSSKGTLEMTGFGRGADYIAVNCDTRKFNLYGTSWTLIRKSPQLPLLAESICVASKPAVADLHPPPSERRRFWQWHCATDRQSEPQIVCFRHDDNHAHDVENYGKNYVLGLKLRVQLLEVEGYYDVGVGQAASTLDKDRIAYEFSGTKLLVDCLSGKFSIEGEDQYGRTVRQTVVPTLAQLACRWSQEKYGAQRMEWCQRRANDPWCTVKPALP